MGAQRPVRPDRRSAELGRSGGISRMSLERLEKSYSEFRAGLWCATMIEFELWWSLINYVVYSFKLS